MWSIKTWSKTFLFNPVVFLSFSPVSCVNNPPSLNKEPVIKIGQRVWEFGELQQKLHIAGQLNPPDEAKKELLREIMLQSLVENWAKKNKVRIPRPPLSREEKAVFGHPRTLLQAFRDHKSYKALYKLFLEDTARRLLEAPLKAQKKFYRQNKALFFEPAHCFLKQIVMEKKKQALTLRQRMEENKDFDLLSRLYFQQQPVPHRVKKGDLEVFDRVCFSPSALSYKPSPAKKFLSPVTKSPYGYHIFLIEGIKQGRQKTFPEVQEQIVALLKESAVRQEIQNQLQEQIKATPVWTNSKLWSQLQ